MNIPVGRRIRGFRMKRGMTQKELGKAVGFSPRTASVRMAQYECGARTPKPELLKQIADVLHVSVDALTTPDFENAADLMHTLFALEDAYIFLVSLQTDSIELRLDLEDSYVPLAIRVMLKTWGELREKYLCGEISKEEYDQWRYNFPNIPKDESEVI